jgi:competence protein ComEA
VPDDDPVADPDADADEDEWPDQPGPDSTLTVGLGRHRAPGRTARIDPGRPAAWALWTVAVLAAAVLVGWTWLHRPAVEQVPVGVSTAAPSTTSVTATATATGAEPATGSAAGAGTTGGVVVVSVVGQVAAPGLVTLPAGSRVADALAAVGGLLPEADPASINAAAVLSDGQQVAVGVPGVAPPAGSAAVPSGGLLDLNTATAADLDALPGIGPVLAQRIVDHRTAHGRFTSVDQLDDVSGIGPAIFADLVDQVRV